MHVWFGTEMEAVPRSELTTQPYARRSAICVPVHQGVVGVVSLLWAGLVVAAVTAVTITAMLFVRRVAAETAAATHPSSTREALGP